jgi:DNA repair ATPase RecN
VVLAELSRQRDATERVMWEATQLATSYDQLKRTLMEMSEVAQNHTWMRNRLVNAERRVEELETAVKRLATPPPAVAPATLPVPFNEPGIQHP